MGITGGIGAKYSLFYHVLWCSITGKSCPANIDLVVQDCSSLTVEFINVSVCYVRRGMDVEAHRLVGLAKYVGSWTWLGSVPSPNEVFTVKKKLNPPPQLPTFFTM